MNAIILVADDDEFVRDVLKTMLADNELRRHLDGDPVHISEVIEASDGGKAVQVFMERHPDLVLLDVLMPGTDGIEATKEITIRDPKAAVLPMTAFSSTKGQDMLDARAKKVISKSVKRTELLNIVAEHLAK